MSILAILATAAGIVSSLVMLPQVHKIFKRKSAKDISISMYISLIVIGIIWILYGIEISNWPIIISNTVGTFFLLWVVYGWYLYGK